MLKRESFEDHAHYPLQLASLPDSNIDTDVDTLPKMQIHCATDADQSANLYNKS